MPFTVAREPAPGGVERRMLAQAGEYVEHPARVRHGVPDSVGRQQGKAGRARPIDQKFVSLLLVREKMPLHFDEQPVAPEDFPQPFAGAGGGSRTARAPGASHRTLLVAGQGNQAVVFRLQFKPGHPALALGRPQMRGRQQRA